jgi:2-phospho-L-lactate guanylyltransferase (CobY/MobA/RfbA family)
MLSYARHSQEIDIRGMKMFDVDAPDLSFDVDTPGDLRWAEKHEDGFAAGIERWERWLEKNTDATAIHRE